MAEIEEYVFKPASARPEQSWAIRDGHVMRRGGSALRLADVKSGVWGDMSYRGTRNAWLHLSTDQDTIKIECTEHGAGPDREIFLSYVVSVLGELNAVAPSTAIELGGGRALKFALFGLGILGTLLGLIFLGAGLSGAGRESGTLIGLGMAMTVGFAALGFTQIPGRGVAATSPAELLRQIEDVPDPNAQAAWPTTDT